MTIYADSDVFKFKKEIYNPSDDNVNRENNNDVNIYIKKERDRERGLKLIIIKYIKKVKLRLERYLFLFKFFVLFTNYLNLYLLLLPNNIK